MKNIIGKPVAGANFFGRERELQELKYISEDEHVLLLAPRRVGKTSEGLLARRIYFSSWDERLRMALGAPEDSFARAILGVCARDPKGAPVSSLQQCLATPVPNPVERGKMTSWLLDVLQSDDYLVEHAGRWRFRSGLLRRYWERHVV